MREKGWRHGRDVLPLNLTTILLYLTNGLPFHWLAFACILQLILIIIVVNIINYNPHYDYGNAFVTPLFAPHELTLLHFRLQLIS